jgi:hypothetical protein
MLNHKESKSRRVALESSIKLPKDLQLSVELLSSFTTSYECEDQENMLPALGIAELDHLPCCQCEDQENK